MAVPLILISESIHGWMFGLPMGDRIPSDAGAGAGGAGRHTRQRDRSAAAHGSPASEQIA
jgi:hypothetical protein